MTSYKDQYYTMYSLRKEVFMTKIIDIIREESDEAKERQRLGFIISGATERMKSQPFQVG